MLTRVFIDIDMPNYYEIIIPMKDNTRVFQVLKVYHIATKYNVFYSSATTVLNINATNNK